MKLNFTFHAFGQVYTYDHWKRHSKRNVNSLYFVHSGTAEYYCNNEKYIMKPGYLYLIPYSADITFSINKNVVFKHTFFDFYSNPPLNPNNIIEIKHGDYSTLDYTVKAISEILSYNRTDDINNVFYFYKNDDENEFTDIIPHYFNAVMLLINSIAPIYSASDERIFEAIQYICENFSQELSVGKIAAQLFLSENYFIKLFKKHVGKTPHQYIKDYRFGMAVAMIETGKSVADTATECGYQSASAFSLAFKNKLGVSPQEFKKNSRN